MTQKAAIGKLGGKSCSAGSCIYLDAGTTTLAIAQHLIHMESLTWSQTISLLRTTCSTTVIAQLFTLAVQCVGKTVPVCREAAATMLRSLMIDQAFISASSWSVRGISTPAEDKVTVKRAIASASRQRVLVCDATKYGQVAWLASTIKRV
ncbi:hypothetical protein ACVXHA_03315 [Escherichia coli]